MQPAAAASDSEPKGEGGAANENIPTGEFFEQVFPPSQLPRATSAKKQFEETDEYQHDRAQQHMATTTDTQSVQCYIMSDFGATPWLSERAFRVISTEFLILGQR